MSADERIAQAKANQEADLRQLAKDKGLNYPIRRLFLRSFKEERILEAWGADGPGPMTLLRRYPVAGQSGGPGPKRREGDRQVPEGVYFVDRFNPQSRFYLSLGVNYPNASDRIRSDQEKPGSDIFIHGDTVSIGCLAITDPLIEEVYLLAIGAKSNRIDVHFYPTKMEGARYQALRAKHPEHRAFWDELEPIFRSFEATRIVPQVRISSTGSYQLVKSARVGNREP